MNVREKTTSEKRLIDANALIAEYDRAHIGEPGKARKLMEDAHTVDAVEVVHAEWLYDGGSGKYFCSACDADALSFKKDDLYGGDLYEVCLTNYCPSCGAKMDGGVD